MNSRLHSFPAQDINFLAPRARLPWTICALFYGNHAELCQRFLSQLYRYTDPSSFHLRAGMNAVCRETERLLRISEKRHGNMTLFPSCKNIFKCPMMRRLFHEPPVGTEWTIWFDDDSYVTDSGWMMDLALAMEKAPDAELFGSLHGVDVSPVVERFIQTAAWNRGLPRQLRQDTGTPAIIFPVGGFWAVRTKRLQQIDWPDLRLQHFEDDYLMGEAMRQQGVRMAHFESGVCINAAPRRAPAEAPSILQI